MVLRGDDKVTHSGFPGGLRPLLRIEQIGIEVLKILLILFIGDLLVVTDPLMPCRHGVETPVNEHAEPFPDKPARIAASEFSHDLLLAVFLVSASFHASEESIEYPPPACKPDPMKKAGIFMKKITPESKKTVTQNPDAGFRRKREKPEQQIPLHDRTIPAPTDDTNQPDKTESFRSFGLRNQPEIPNLPERPQKILPGPQKILLRLPVSKLRRKLREKLSESLFRTASRIVSPRRTDSVRCRSPSETSTDRQAPNNSPPINPHKQNNPFQYGKMRQHFSRVKDTVLVAVQRRDAGRAEHEIPPFPITPSTPSTPSIPSMPSMPSTSFIRFISPFPHSIFPHPSMNKKTYCPPRAPETEFPEEACNLYALLFAGRSGASAGASHSHWATTTSSECLIEVETLENRYPRYGISIK